MLIPSMERAVGCVVSRWNKMWNKSSKRIQRYMATKIWSRKMKYWWWSILCCTKHMCCIIVNYIIILTNQYVKSCLQFVILSVCLELWSMFMQHGLLYTAKNQWVCEGCLCKLGLYTPIGFYCSEQIQNPEISKYCKSHYVVLENEDRWCHY